jgi:malate dehydrogenase (oxaloacetate-decarboxylating)(NADP+)
MKSGVATRPIADIAQYRERLNAFVFRSGFVMKPLFASAKSEPKRVFDAEGEDERVRRATQVAIEEGLARPILIGRPAVIEARLKRFGLAIRPERDFVLINPQEDARYRKYVDLYVEAAGRRGVTPDAARTVMRTNATVIAACMVRARDADAAICGVEGGYMDHLRHIRDIIGCAPGVSDFSALSLLITGKGHFFLADTEVRVDPTAEEIAEMAVLAAAHVRRFGLEPKIALVSHSDFGSFDSPSARKMRRATALIRDMKVDFEVDGEMHADSALDPIQRARVYPHSRLTGEANVLIFPSLDAANITYETIKVLGDALPVGPILVGAAKPVHVLTPSVTARGIVNMTAVAAVEAQACQ